MAAKSATHRSTDDVAPAPGTATVPTIATPPAPESPERASPMEDVEVEVQALRTISAKDLGIRGDDSTLRPGETRRLPLKEAYKLSDDGIVMIVGMHPARGKLASEYASNRSTSSTSREERSDATRFGNREGQSPPNDLGAPNANATHEASKSTDDIRKESRRRGGRSET